MKKYKNDKLLYFNNDDEFCRFCINPNPIITQSTDENGVVHYLTSYEFTDSYNKAINDGKYFVLNDPNSSIIKRNAVTYSTITKEVSNIFDNSF